MPHCGSDSSNWGNEVIEMSNEEVKPMTDEDVCVAYFRIPSSSLLRSLGLHSAMTLPSAAPGRPGLHALVIAMRTPMT